MLIFQSVIRRILSHNDLCSTCGCWAPSSVPSTLFGGTSKWIGASCKENVRTGRNTDYCVSHSSTPAAGTITTPSFKTFCCASPGPFPFPWMNWDCFIMKFCYRSWPLPNFGGKKHQAGKICDQSINHSRNEPTYRSFSSLLNLCIFYRRRFVWNFFRLENEHLNNCGEFRAVRNIAGVSVGKRADVNLRPLLPADLDQEDGQAPTTKKDRYMSPVSQSLTLSILFFYATFYVSIQLKYSSWLIASAIRWLIDLPNDLSIDWSLFWRMFLIEILNVGLLVACKCDFTFQFKYSLEIELKSRFNLQCFCWL